MKKIIDGRRYNTETATEIGSASARGFYSSDFRYWQESLYRTKNGAFFLAGEGGALSRYSRAMGQNGSTGGSGIVPLSRAEALEWCERYLDADEAETLFADDIKDA